MECNVYGKGRRRVIVPDSHHVFDDIVAEHGHSHKNGSPFGSSSSDSSHITNLSASMTQSDQHSKRPGLRKKVKTISIYKEQNSTDEDLSCCSASLQDKSDKSDMLFLDVHDSIILCTPVKGKNPKNALKDVNTKAAAKKKSGSAQPKKGKTKIKCAKNKGKEKENTIPTPENLPDFDSIEQEVFNVMSSTPISSTSSQPQQPLVSRISDHGDCKFKSYVSSPEESDSLPSSTNFMNVTLRRSERKTRCMKNKYKEDISRTKAVHDNLIFDTGYDRYNESGDDPSVDDISAESDDGNDLTASFMKLHLCSRNLRKKLACDSPLSESTECANLSSSYTSPNNFDHLNSKESKQRKLTISDSIEESVMDSDEEEKEEDSKHTLQHLVIEEEEEEDSTEVEKSEELFDDGDDEDIAEGEEANGHDEKDFCSSISDPEVSRYQLTDHAMSFSEKLSNSSICDVLITAEERVLSLCEQREPISFTDCISQRVMPKCIKIGEGVYGEVFRTCIHGETVALKIIPIEGDAIVNDCPQKKFEEILPEIVIAKELSDLARDGRNRTENFCQVNRISCVKGEFPAPLLEQWDIYSKNKVSENDRPDMFLSDQLFIVFEFVDGGRALENFKFSNHREAFSVLRQVVFGLAVAEEELEFEHRDLHIGNILVRSSQQATVSFTLDNEEFEFPSEGVVATIIDFTISRLKKDGCAVFCDVSTDEGLFEGTGDFQFDVYRDMRKENDNDWQKFCPHSNVLWVNYLCKKLMSSTNYKENGRGYRDIQRHMRSLIDSMLDKESCVQLARDLACWAF